MISLTKHVENVESAWFACDPNDERRRHLDSHILAIVTAWRTSRTATHLWLPNEVTLYAPKNWQLALDPSAITIGATTPTPPCDLHCKGALSDLLGFFGAAEKGKTFISSIAIDATSGVCQRNENTCALHMDQSHVHGIYLSKHGAVFIIEPTVPAPWFGSFHTFYGRIMPKACKAVGLTYGGFQYGANYDHTNLCRYKIAFDMLHPSIQTQTKFEKAVRRVAAVLQDETC